MTFLLENMVRGLDDDEVGFLELVDKTKLAEESRIFQEERDELEEYRKAVAKASEERLENEVKLTLITPGSSKASAPSSSGSSTSSLSIGTDKQSQRSKLMCVVKRKSVSEENENSKRLKQGF